MNPHKGPRLVTQDDSGTAVTQPVDATIRGY